MSITVLCGDCRTTLMNLPEKSVHVVVTSPPFFNLRLYSGEQALIFGGDSTHNHEWNTAESNHRIYSENASTHAETSLLNERIRDAQKNRSNINVGKYCQCGAWYGNLGNEPTPSQFVSNLVECFQAVKRVLRDDGLLFVNLGDSYSGSNGNGYKQTLHEINRTSGEEENFDLRRSVGRQDELPAGNLLEIPSLVALAMQRDGWILRSRIPIFKKSSMPESVSSRPSSAVEYFFMFAKDCGTQFWTHRNLRGTRIQPTPDYRWLDRANSNTETDQEPECWQTERMHNSKKVHIGECDCPKRWRRINLWSSHDYFWDADAVRVKTASNGRGSGNFARKENHQPDGRSGFATGIPWQDDGYGRNMRNSDLFFESWQGLMLDELDNPLAVVIGQSGFKGEHYASFNSDLLVPLILGSTSQYGCCSSCGAPYTRTIEKRYQRHEQWYGDKFNAAGRHDRGAAGKSYNEPIGLITTGWQPTCDCATTETRPCITLDCFGGASTTAMVSDRHGRDAISCELSSEYVKLSGNRLTNDAPLFTSVEVVKPEPITEKIDLMVVPDEQLKQLEF